MWLAAMLPQGASPVVVARVRQHSSRLQLNLRAETVQPMEGAPAFWVNSADEYLIMAEDLEEDLAAAAAAAAVAATAATAVTAAGTTTRAPTSSTWQTATARPGTVPATDAS